MYNTVTDGLALGESFPTHTPRSDKGFIARWLMYFNECFDSQGLVQGKAFHTDILHIITEGLMLGE